MRRFPCADCWSANLATVAVHPPSPRPGADRGTVVKFALFYTSGTAPAAPQAGQHRDYRVDLLGGPAMMVEGPPGAGLRPVRAEPVVDSFRDGRPARLEHHVVTHVGEELCFGAICARRCAYFLSMHAPSSRAQDQHRGCHTFRSRRLRRPSTPERALSSWSRLA